MEHFELVPLKNGVMSLRALEPRETFHPGIGPMEEASILHVRQQRLVERCRAMRTFQLWDVGLGAAANALSAIKALLAAGPLDCDVTIHSFDKTLSPLRFALANAQALVYPLGLEALLEELILHGHVQVAPRITWHLHLGDFSAGLSSEPLPAPDAIFYDPYSPTGNPEMWTVEVFAQLLARLDPARPCLLSNYTCSTRVRVTLLLAGFYVGVGCKVDQKHETTVAANQLECLEQPLTRKWLENRVRVSHTAAPIRQGALALGFISDADYAALTRHPQFAG